MFNRVSQVQSYTDITKAYVAASVTSIKNAVGYHSSGYNRVLGSMEGKAIFIPAGTYDLGTTTLWLAPGTKLIGAGVGKTIIQGKLFADLNNAAYQVELEDITFDANGQTAIVGGDIPAAANYGCFTFQDGRFIFKRCRFTNSSVAAASLNNLTFVDDGTITRAFMFDCEIDNAYDDCVSTKAGGGTANEESVLYLERCYVHDPGSGTSNQCVTPHEGFRIICNLCNIQHPTGEAITTSAAEIEVYNSYINSLYLVGLNKLVNNHIVLLGEYGVEGVNLYLPTSGNSAIEGNVIASPNAESDWKIIGGTPAASTTHNIISNHIYGYGSGNALYFATAGAGTINFNNNRVSQCYRGIDARPNADTMTINVYNNIVDASNAFLLADTGASDCVVNHDYNVLEDSTTTSAGGNITAGGHNINGDAEINYDGTPIIGGNCHKAGDATKVTGLGFDLFGQARIPVAGTINIGPVESIIRNSNYDCGGIKVPHL